MIAALRTRHRRTFVLLTLVLPAFYGAALIARPAPPLGSLPLDLAPPDETPVGSAPLGAPPRALLADDVLRLDLAGAWNEPDTLVYATNELMGGPALPPDARLIGTLSTGEGPRSVRFPKGDGPPPRALVLYSLAHGAVAARIAVEEP